MAEVKEKRTRRQFLKNAAILGALLLGFAQIVRAIWLYLFPPKRPKTYHRYLVCKEGELKVGEAKEITLGKTPVYVIRLEGGYRVYSGICTHLGCIVRWEKEKNRFFCPCHKGIYAPDGRVISGPPPRPLDQYKVEVDKDLVFMFVEDKQRSPWT